MMKQHALSLPSHDTVLTNGVVYNDERRTMMCKEGCLSWKCPFRAFQSGAILLQHTGPIAMQEEEEEEDVSGGRAVPEKRFLESRD